MDTERAGAEADRVAELTEKLGRLEMLEEAIEVIRNLWTGETYSCRGDYHTVENARL